MSDTTLPPYVATEISRHGKTCYYYRRGLGPRMRLPDDPHSAEFRERYENALKVVPIPHVKDMPVSKIETRKQRTEATLIGAMRSAKTRAKAKGVEFSLTADILLDMAEEQDFRCSLTGIEFFAPHDWAGRVDPFIPSIDRIQAGGPYSKGNVRLVIYALNAMLLDWGEPLFLQVANSYRYWSGTKNAQANPALFIQRPSPANKSRG